MKRKRSSVQHLSDQDTIQRAVLPVATRLTNPNGPPVTGDEYLKLVRDEAEQCPDVVIAPDRERILSESSSNWTPAQLPAHWRWTNFNPTQTKNDTQNPISKPTASWRAAFIKQFTLQRKRLQMRREQLESLNMLNMNDYNVPLAKDAVGWMRFCYGEIAARQYAECVLNQTIETTTSSEEMTLQAAKAQLLARLQLEDAVDEEAQEIDQGHDPDTTFIAKLPQNVVLSLFQYHIEYLNVLELTVDQGVWLFALLLRVDAVMTSEEMAIIRDLCRCCQAIRARITSPSDERLPMVNIIITIVTDYFGQRDLA